VALTSTPSHPGVKRAANTGEVGPEDVIEELQERNPEVPDYAFEDAIHTDRVWNGFDDGGDE